MTPLRLQPTHVATIVRHLTVRRDHLAAAGDDEARAVSAVLCEIEGQQAMPTVQAGDVWSPSGSTVRYVVRAVGNTDAHVRRSGVPISVPLRMFQACDLIERNGAVVARESST